MCFLRYLFLKNQISYRIRKSVNNCKILLILLLLIPFKSYCLDSSFDNNKKVSIIVPIYNVEAYLEKCLKSLKKQTYKNIEIICINDGSTDNSLLVLQRLAKEDNRIKIINKKNEGVSIARNQGLDLATGEYVMFVDPDDFVDPKFVEKPLKQILKTNADIAIFGMNNISKGKIRQRPDIDRISKKNHPKKEDFLYFQDSACDKMYKGEFLKQHKIRFYPHIKTAEDGIFNLYCFYLNPKYTVLPDRLYYYLTDRNGSATQSGIEGLVSDMVSFGKLLESNNFKKASSIDKKLTLSKILRGISSYKWKIKTIIEHIEYFLILEKYMDLLKNHFSKDELEYNEDTIREVKRFDVIEYLYKNLSN